MTSGRDGLRSPPQAENFGVRAFSNAFANVRNRSFECAKSQNFQPAAGCLHPPNFITAFQL